MGATDRAQRIRQKIAGLRLWALRQRFGLDLGPAAETLSLTTAELRAQELGLRPVPTDGLWRLAHSLGVTPAEAFGIVQVASTPGALSDRALNLRRKALGAVLAADREASGLSAEAAEASIGLPEGGLRAAERGEAALPLGDLEGLAALYGRHVEDWLDDGASPEDKMMRTSPDQEARRFMRRPEANRYALAAMALSRLDDEALSALEDALTLLRSGEK